MTNLETDSGPFGPVLNGTMVIVFYQYRPDQASAYAFTSLFALATLGHLAYMLRLKAWIFIPFVLGGIGKLRRENLTPLIKIQANGCK